MKRHGSGRKLPTIGQPTLKGSGNDHHVERVAHYRVTVLPPRTTRGEHGNEPLGRWAVQVREIEPPRGQEPLQRIVLTNVKIQTFAEACEWIDGYGCRPMIEVYPKTQKTGCGFEEPPFTTRKAMEAIIALLSVAATRLLRLRDPSRQADAEIRPATEVADQE